MLIRSFLICVVFITNAVAQTSVNKGDREGHDMTPPIAEDAIPPAPILSVAEALASMQVQKGFVLENVASEPLVQSPVAITFDGNGRIWVAEMITFMPDLDGNNEEVPEGNIVILDDTDGDGKIDKRTVFLSDVILPRSISLVKGGILYADINKLYFAEVLENDTLGIREVVDETYAQGGSVEHKPNAMMYSLDNWYYNAKSDKKYKTLPLTAEVPSNAEEVYRNQYWKMVRAVTDRRGQWGLSMDDYGRLFHNGNSSPAQGEFLLPGSLMKNPGFQRSVKANNIGSTRVYPARINPGVNRAYLPSTLVSEGENKGKLKNFTAASGNTVYRGEQFPKQFYGVSFTPEPAGNLITVRDIIEEKGKLSGREIYPKSEIVASTDERFRPVNLYTAPDGSLYIVDMYHGVIQHKEFLTTYLREQSEARGLDKHNSSMGRIYRLRWADNALSKKPSLLHQGPSSWIAHIDASNGWFRDIARQLIVQNEQYGFTEELIKIATKSNDHRGRINALWALEGLQALTGDIILAALKDPHSKVVTAAIELSTRLPSREHSKIAKQLLNLAPKDYETALHIALVAGEIEHPDALLALKTVIETYEHEPWIREAAISGLTGKEKTFKGLINGHASSEFLAMLDSVGEVKVEKTNILNLSGNAQQSYNRGKQLFETSAACFGCHGKNGEGIDGMGPQLANSEWVEKSPERLVKVLLHGLMGPITVSGKQYNLPMVMPGLARNLNDQQLADVATYIRNNWGNQSSVIEAEFVKQMRENTQSRQMPFTEKDFQ